jgi:hypothetical protein
MTDTQQTAAICREINAISQDLKTAMPILKHQNAIGLTIFISSIALIITAMYLYLMGNIGAWSAILWIAFWTSILHELEHDLIHQLYFKQNGLMHHAMLLGVWLFRPLTLNPWMRRHLHYHHHKYSGTASDIEERGLNNGMAWGFLRLITTADLLMAGALRTKSMRNEVRALYKQGLFTPAEIVNLRRVTLLGFLPFGIPLHLIWYSFLGYYALVAMANCAIWCCGTPIASANSGFYDALQLWANGASMPWQQYIQSITPLVVLLVAPNMLRQFCLHFITSNMHYYGDVERGNILQQTQVLNAWYFLPFQLFCFNFGSTHTIHHFVVNEPFYIRQLTAPKAHKVLKKYSVRFNDIGTFVRANRYLTQH